MDRLDVVRDTTGQRVYFYPQEGRPSSTPSVQILDQYGTVITAAATTYVTQDTVSTTLSAGASAGDKSVTLTATTGGEVGVEYLITSTLGEKERVIVRSINTSSKVVTLDEPLEYDHASSSTFVGTRFYRTLQTAEVDELAELYRARATYAVGGLNYTLEVPFDVVLVPLPNLLSAAYIKANRPGIMAQEHAETRGSDFAGLRDQAWDRVRKGIRRMGEGDDERWRPALVRTGDDLELWGLAEFDLLALQNGVDVLPGDWSGPEALQELRERVSAAKSEALLTLHWLDKNEDDSRGEDEERPLTMTFKR
jgi:hypothetical protein